jgi:integrase
MTIYKRGAKGVFYMDFVCKGTRVFKSTGKFTKREAILVEATEKKRLMEESALSPREKAARMLLSEAVKVVYDERWKDCKDARKTEQRAMKLVEFIGDIPIGKIDEDVVRALIRKLDGSGAQPATVNRYLACLKTLLRHMRQMWEHIKLKKERKGRIRVVSRDEETEALRLLRSKVGAKAQYYTEVADLVEVLVDVGMRLSEALRLEYIDVDFKANLISIWINKGEKPRSVPMTKRVRSIMEARKLANKVKPFKITVDQAERAWQWVRLEMGLQDDKEFVLHALRHTCASRLVNNSVDLYVVKEWLGHSTIQVTEKYAHLSPHKLKDAADTLEPEDTSD